MKMPKVKILIFDLDGVIADTDTGRFILLKDILSEYGIDIEMKNNVHDLSGISTLKFLKQFYPEISSFHDAIVSKRHQQYLADLQKYCIPFPDSLDVIRNLSSRYTLYIATTNDPAIAEKLLVHLRVRQYFKEIFGRNITEYQTDNIKSYKTTLSLLNISSSDCMVIEDSRIGIEAAKKEHIFCIGFNPGEDPSLNEIADVSVKNYAELERLLLHKAC
jgi:beta-phosphoglucomutase-like phosphatase (HAD superfamily)